MTWTQALACADSAVVTIPIFSTANRSTIGLPVRYRAAKVLGVRLAVLGWAGDYGRTTIAAMVSATMRALTLRSSRFA